MAYRYLIVIDDVQHGELYDIISSFHTDGAEGRIIVTTTVQLPKATRCSCGDGLPLALHLDCTCQFLKMGELIQGTYEEACGTLSAETLRRMESVLDSKYESVYNLFLEDYFLYFCMFPRDHAVRRNPLIRRWLAEGLVLPEPGPEDDASPQAVAFQIMKTFTDSSIIQSTQVSNNGKVKRCRSPWMVLDYISRKSISENFIALICREPLPAQPLGPVRRLSLHPNNGRLDLPEDLSRLRTLAVFPTADPGNNYGAIFKSGNYELLRVLDLKQCADLNGSHLQDICNMLLLKYLSLGNSIARVPRKIAKLQLLETLEMRRTETVEVPVEVILLPKLKHLLGKFRLFEGDHKNKDFKKSKCQLETLAGFVAGKKKGFAELMSHMGKLRKVKIWCDSTADKASLAHLSEAIQGFIRKGTDIPLGGDRSLSIDVQECSEAFLDSLQAHGELNSLKLCGKLGGVPPFVTLVAGIEEVCLSSTNLSGDVILAALGALKLKYLKLIEENLGQFVIGEKHFPSLLRMCFVGGGAQSLQGVTIHARALPRLMSLHLLCGALVGVPPGIQIGSLEGLKEVGLHSGVTNEAKDEWQAAARGHRNRPSVLFIDPPNSTGDGDLQLHGSNSTTPNRISSITKFLASKFGFKYGRNPDR